MQALQCKKVGRRRRTGAQMGGGASDIGFASQTRAKEQVHARRQRCDQ